jgi:hypothetical protein
VSGKAERVFLQNVPKSRALMMHAAAAIHHVTIITDRPASIRTAALHGIDRILQDDRIELELVFRHFRAVDWRAPHYVHIGLKPEDLTSIRECQNFLVPIATDQLRKADILILGLLRMARPEFGWHPNMTCLDV